MGAPKWQAAAVKNYLAEAGAKGVLPPSKLYNASRRASPDVSALGYGFQVVVGNRTRAVGGTSASAPTVAAMIALLNDARHAAGKPSMGFLNPFLYQNAAAAFTDVIVGNNVNRGQGWQCEKGWDPVTGLGTPKFAALKAAAMAAV